MNRKSKKALVQAGVQFVAIVLALVLILAMGSIANSQQLPTRTIKAKAYSTKTLSANSASPGSSIAWEVAEPLDQQFSVSRDGRQIVFFVDAPKVVVNLTVIDWENKSFIKLKTVVVPDEPLPPGPEPGPGPGPNPPDPQPVIPDGFAGEVYREAVKVNRPADCVRLASVFENISAQVAAGGLTTLEAASAELARQNDALDLDVSWRVFGNWLAGKMNNDAQTLAKAREMFTEIAKGLNAAGGKR